MKKTSAPSASNSKAVNPMVLRRFKLLLPRSNQGHTWIFLISALLVAPQSLSAQQAAPSQRDILQTAQRGDWYIRINADATMQGCVTSVDAVNTRVGRAAIELSGIQLIERRHQSHTAPLIAAAVGAGMAFALLQSLSDYSSDVSGTDYVILVGGVAGIAAITVALVTKPKERWSKIWERSSAQPPQPHH